MHPDYQGQGLATRLLKSACNLADEAGQDVYLEGTPAARKLYEKYGFECLQVLHLKSVDYSMAVMIRRAPNRSNGVH